MYANCRGWSVITIFTSAAASRVTTATPNSRFESKSPPRLYKWSRPSPFPPYYSYQYETIRDVVPPDPRSYRSSSHHLTLRHWLDDDDDDDDDDERSHRDEARRRNPNIGLRIKTKRGAFVFDRNIWNYVVIHARRMRVLPLKSDGGKVP